MIHIRMAEQDADPRLEALLIRAAKAVLKQQKRDAGIEMSIMLGDDELLEQLNKQHLNENHPTDVLSFPGNTINPETGNIYLGDIAISLSRADAQAEAAGHDLETELQLLAVHGVLHLLGHDHAAEKEKDHMWAAQGEILSGLNVSLDMVSLEGR